MVVNLFFLFGEGFEPLEALLLQEPVLVAGAAPVGEVLVGDEGSTEEFGHDAFGFGLTVYPWEDGAAEFAVVEAVVELFAEGVGEAGDFADAGWCHNGKDWWMNGFLDGWMEKCEMVSWFGFWFLFPF